MDVYIHGILGDDTTGDGSIEAPYKTLDKVFAPGSGVANTTNLDVDVYIKGGLTYSCESYEPQWIFIDSVDSYHNVTVQPYPTDGKKPIFDGSVLFYISDDGNLLITKSVEIRNIIFLAHTNFNLVSLFLNKTIYRSIDVQGASDNFLHVYISNCDFVGDYTPINDKVKGYYYQPEPENIIVGIYRRQNYHHQSILEVYQNVFYRMTMGIFVHYQSGTPATFVSLSIWNNIYYACGDGRRGFPARYTIRSVGLGTLGKGTEYLYGCDMELPASAFVNPNDAHWVIRSHSYSMYPKFINPDIYDFTLQSDSPCIDLWGGGAGENDAHIPPAHGEDTSDVGSYGGGHNLDTITDRVTVTINGVSQYAYPYDVITLEAKGGKFFVRWDGDYSVIDDRYDKNTTLTVETSNIIITERYERKINMTAGKFNLDIEQGANFKRTLLWKDSNEDAVDLTNYSATMSIYDRIGGTQIDSLTSGSEITLGGANGTIEIDIPAADTSSYDFTYGVYDLEVVDASSNVTKLMRGKVTLIKEVG